MVRQPGTVVGPLPYCAEQQAAVDDKVADLVDGLPEWLIPPPGGFRAEDLDRLPPEAPSHVELIDGGLVFNAPRRSWHSHVAGWLFEALRTAAPSDVVVDVGMTIRLGERQRPEADVLAARTELDYSRTWYDAADVLLVIEVVSEDSRIRDMDTKPRRYAEAGIPHFWRIDEGDDGLPVIHVFERESATGTYVPTGIHRGRLAVEVPFAVTIELATLIHGPGRSGPSGADRGAPR